MLCLPQHGYVKTAGSWFEMLLFKAVEIASLRPKGFSVHWVTSERLKMPDMNRMDCSQQQSGLENPVRQILSEDLKGERGHASICFYSVFVILSWIKTGEKTSMSLQRRKILVVAEKNFDKSRRRKQHWPLPLDPKCTLRMVPRYIIRGLHWVLCEEYCIISYFLDTYQLVSAVSLWTCLLHIWECLLTRLPHVNCIRLGSVHSSHLPFKNWWYIFLRFLLHYICFGNTAGFETFVRKHELFLSLLTT